MLKNIVSLLCMILLSLAGELVAQPMAPLYTEVEVPTAKGTLAMPATGMLFIADQNAWARVTSMVRPIYPIEAIAKGEGSVVDVNVLVGINGLMKEISLIESTPKNPAFEDAIRDVIKHWQFLVPVAEGCQPAESAGQIRLTFSVIAGDGKIVLSHSNARSPGKGGASPGVVSLNYKEVYAGIRYPHAARKAGVTAEVWMALTVDLSQGTLISAKSAAVLASKRIYASQFEEAVMEVIQKLKFRPVENYTKPVEVCLPFQFRLR
jgi:TonB family protein